MVGVVVGGWCGRLGSGVGSGGSGSGLLVVVVVVVVVGEWGVVRWVGG